MPVLPPDFADLEPFADWALPTEGERYGKRLASTMDELQAFYDAALRGWRTAPTTSSRSPRRHLRGRRAPALAVQSLVTASFPVEVWRQPRVPESGASSFDCVVEPTP